jgi:alkanesulfonate monooxygenase SsuD/methylene tetrahydromethanopterin reductase-like flavin-dependent oxidoreductase (luciferase family)
MSDLLFGVQVPPVAADPRVTLEIGVVADEAGLELLGIQDHPYAPQFLDTLTVIGAVLDRTTRVRVFPDVASLPLRPPAVLAKAAASLDVLSGGRFELGLGSGAVWRAITAMGGGQLGAAEALRALEEGVAVIRSMWREGETARAGGDHHRVSGVHAGPAPAHPIGIWIGSVGPRANALTGRIADGWAAPIPSYLPYERWASANAEIDAGARKAGRDPADVLRIAQIVGSVTAQPVPGEFELAGARPLRGTVDQWVSTLTELAASTPFRAFVFWPEDPSVDQVELFGRQVAPAVREAVAAAR